MRGSKPVLLVALLPAWLFFARPLLGEDVSLNGKTFKLLDGGYTLELAAGPPLVERPICADFDEQGHLYVAESSGSNDPVGKQLEEKPHSILRLTDTNGDGRFDERTVFADRMMFPEGCLWHEGSLYVAAPPQIWKLTDTDRDGRAERREVWFDAKTLTGCANDLHGPYAGRDGWIYWCKGAFAEQTYERPGQRPFVTQAAHIFRRRPEGGIVEPVMTGGMDNPVEVVFTPSGERLFTTTFLQHPGDGKRDGLIHAIYGGVYGKNHDVIRDHFRSGDLMPVLKHFGAAAPCGLALLESTGLGTENQSRVAACLFNLHKVTLHKLISRGATFATEDQDLLASDDLDFHPTDVLEDADGSLLVVDTGGWYKLCCPTSQLWKPDVLGAIYRIRRSGQPAVTDPRGQEIDWDQLAAPQLAELLEDERFAVRNQARRRLRAIGSDAVSAVNELAHAASNPQVRLEAVWTLAGIPGDAAREAIREALGDADATVQQAAIHAASVWKDAGARDQILELLGSDSPHIRRASAEALGRIGQGTDALVLLHEAGRSDDRIMRHSATYAAWEIGDVSALREGLAQADGRTVGAALLALEQLPQGQLSFEDIQPFVKSTDGELRNTIRWIAARHADWAGDFAPVIAHRLGSDRPTDWDLADLRAWLPSWYSAAEIRDQVGHAVANPKTAPEVLQVVLGVMGNVAADDPPISWIQALALRSENDDPGSLGPTLDTLGKMAWRSEQAPKLASHLHQIAARESLPIETKLAALAAVPVDDNVLSQVEFTLVLSSLEAVNTVADRARAASVLQRVKLSPSQLAKLANQVDRVAPTELDRVLTPFETTRDATIVDRLFEALGRSTGLASLPRDDLHKRFAGLGTEVIARLDEVLQRVDLSRGDQLRFLDELSASLEPGDIRRGQLVFQSAKASCYACHQIGYLGGNIGPDLTHIGRIRAERDLLESIVFPSLSIVRSYEPVSLVLADGQVVHGLIRDQNDDSLELVVGANQFRRVRRDQIDEMRPGEVSVMPAGLDQQLSRQELADLVAFLMACQ